MAQNSAQTSAAQNPQTANNQAANDGVTDDAAANGVGPAGGAASASQLLNDDPALSGPNGVAVSKDGGKPDKKQNSAKTDGDAGAQPAQIAAQVVQNLPIPPAFQAVAQMQAVAGNDDGG